jgi:hypothetical protein
VTRVELRALAPGALQAAFSECDGLQDGALSGAIGPNHVGVRGEIRGEAFEPAETTELSLREHQMPTLAATRIMVTKSRDAPGV